MQLGLAELVVDIGGAGNMGTQWWDVTPPLITPPKPVLRYGLASGLPRGGKGVAPGGIIDHRRTVSSQSSPPND